MPALAGFTCNTRQASGPAIDPDLDLFSRERLRQLQAHLGARRPWPADLPAQMRAVADTLAATPGALTESALADRFTGRGPWKKRLPQILQTLEALGRARSEPQAGGAAWRSA